MENKELLNKIKVYRAMKNISQEETGCSHWSNPKDNQYGRDRKVYSLYCPCAEDSTLFRGSVEEIFVLNDEASY